MSVCSSTHSNVPCSKCDNAKKPNSATKCQPFLTSTIDRYANRQEDLDEQHRQLQNKITTMEKLLPVLIAFGMCNQQPDETETCEPACAVLDRVREMMKKLSPMPDPADELIAELASSVEQLDQETAELHDKIIHADVQLEEHRTELESLELANRELEEQIHQLESRPNPQASLQSISSDDRICLARIRKLAEDQIKMKSNIRELEEREKVLCCQIQKIFGGPCSDKRLCEAARNSKHHVHKMRSRKKKDCKCNCQKKKTECSCKNVKNCEHNTETHFQMLKKPKKSESSKSCHCDSSSIKKTSKKNDESPDRSYYTSIVSHSVVQRDISTSMQRIKSKIPIMSTSQVKSLEEYRSN